MAPAVTLPAAAVCSARTCASVFCARFLIRHTMQVLFLVCAMHHHIWAPRARCHAELLREDLLQSLRHIRESEDRHLLSSVGPIVRLGGVRLNAGSGHSVSILVQVCPLNSVLSESCAQRSPPRRAPPRCCSVCAPRIELSYPPFSPPASNTRLPRRVLLLSSCTSRTRPSRASQVEVKKGTHSLPVG